MPGGGRSDLFHAIIAPQSARASECRDSAFGTDSSAGEDEHAILARNLDHMLQCNACRTPYEECWRPRASVLATVVLLLATVGCGEPAPKTDAELGLSSHQSNGRRVFERDCAACHSAYSSSGSKGPSLKNIFRKKFLPSGLPATDRFVEQTIASGRNMMPPMGEAISEEELDDLMAYLHTL
jgi:mono/diheme cytochrome c family protein